MNLTYMMQESQAYLNSIAGISDTEKCLYSISFSLAAITELLNRLVAIEEQRYKEDGVKTVEYYARDLNQLEGVAKFHRWGSDYHRFESGPGNFTVAIIELPDGSIKKVDPECIKFKEDKDE